jgi:hypothetical protein
MRHSNYFTNLCLAVSVLFLSGSCDKTPTTTGWQYLDIEFDQTSLTVDVDKNTDKVTVGYHRTGLDIPEDGIAREKNIMFCILDDSTADLSQYSIPNMLDKENKQFIVYEWPAADPTGSFDITIYPEKITEEVTIIIQIRDGGSLFLLKPIDNIRITLRPVA